MRLDFASQLKNHQKGQGSWSFLMEFCPKKIQYFFIFSVFQCVDAVAMLASFRTNVHKLRSEKDIPSYGRLSEKG